MTSVSSRSVPRDSSTSLKWLGSRTRRVQKSVTETQAVERKKIAFGNVATVFIYVTPKSEGPIICELIVVKK